MKKKPKNGEIEADENKILDLIHERRYNDIFTFILAAPRVKSSRRAGIGLLWGIRATVWIKFGKRLEELDDPDGVAYLEKLFRLDPDVRFRDDMGRTALMYAVRKIKPDLAQKLVDLGADLYAVDHDPGRSVLGWAKASAEPDKMVTWVEQAMKEKGKSSSRPPSPHESPFQERAGESPSLSNGEEKLGLEKDFREADNYSVVLVQASTNALEACECLSETTRDQVRPSAAQGWAMIHHLGVEKGEAESLAKACSAELETVALAIEHDDVSSWLALVVFEKGAKIQEYSFGYLDEEPPAEAAERVLFDEDDGIAVFAKGFGSEISDEDFLGTYDFVDRLLRERGAFLGWEAVG